MAELSDLGLKDRLYMATYAYRKAEWSRATILDRPLSEARVAVITSAGLHRPDQEPFGDVKGGDFSFREIPLDTPRGDLLEGQRSSAWDREPLGRDRNVALPLDRLRELAGSGRIGEVAPRHFSFQGNITAPKRLVAKTSPVVAAALRDDGVDVVLLTPV